MKWGQEWGQPWGWPGPPPSTVMVRKIRSKFVPCDQCKWFTVCVVPKKSFLPKVGTPASRNYYRCEDYSPKNLPYRPI